MRRTAWAVIALLCTLAVLPSAVAKGVGWVAPDERLVEAQLEYDKLAGTRAQGLDAYVALRRIWRSWEQTDPRKVEEALLLAAEDTRKPPQVRAYARELSAYARVRRGDRDGAEQVFEDLGYITRWLVVGPFDNEGKGGFEQEFGPDADAAAPLVPGRAYSGKERPVRWREMPNVFRYGWMDFGSILRPRVNICAHATTYLQGLTTKDGKSQPADKARTITLFAGARGAVRVSFNGEVVLEDDAYRGYDTGRLATSVSLRPGKNRLSVKVCGDDTAPLFSLRVGDAKGNPDTDIVATADVSSSQEAGATVKAALDAAEKGKKQPRHPTSLQGPRALVQKIADNKAASAADLELAARYLILTGGDDQAVHQARDLATRAAEKKPTVKRHLLVAGLAEDRNAAGESIEAAEKLAKDDDIEVMLARARHLRTGPTSREAFEVYDRVLELDPDNLVALRGRVELYNAAGLRRTALSALESALERRPHSVLLTSMVASQRQALGQDASAQQAEDHYAALRADDTSYLSGRLSLSLAKRNEKAAEHWLGRLLDADRHSPWSYRRAARTHRQMGQKERAIVDLEAARAIAPEDIGVLQHLADLEGRAGNREGQLALLQEVLRLRPQAVDVRKYVEHIEPPEEPADEKYAMPAEEFLKKRHAPDDGHPRRTLRDLTVSTVYENGLGTQYRQIVFQPLTDASAALSRQYAFQYQADRQRVRLKGAKVYRTDGSVDEAIESGEGAANDPSISMYTSARTYYVQFPRLEPGDVVELRYRIDDVTARNEYDDYYGEVVFMQSDEPIGNAEYVLITPKSRKLQVDAQVPNLKESVEETKDSRIYRFVASDVPALKPEANMPPWPEVLGFVHVSTYETWDDLGKWYWGLVKEQLDTDEETRKLARKITKDAKTDAEKVTAVYNWVIKNTRYVALEFGIYGYKPHRCVQTVNRGWGDCKDKATVIVTLLRELGIDANLVIVRTGMRGDFNSKLPSLAPFDHAIAYVPSLGLYLDGTAEHTGSSELPVMDQGALALLVLDGKAKLVRIPRTKLASNLIHRTVNVDLSKDGSAKVDLDYQVKGFSARSYRAHYEAEASRKDRLARDLGGEFPGLEIVPNGIKTSDLSDVEKPVSLQVKGKVPQYGRPEGKLMSVPVALRMELTSRYAALSERTQDVMINGFSPRVETVRVKLPAGAKVDAAPPAVSGKSKFGSYSVKYEKEGRDVTVETTITLTAHRVSPAEYPAFRQFCAEVDRAMSHRLVIAP